jgi:hypothetical protein
VRQLAAAGHHVESVERPQFPIADGLPALLHAIAARCDVAIAVASASANSTGWLVRELSLAALYPTFIIAVAPEWTQYERLLDPGDFRVLPPGASIVPRIEEWFSPAPRPSATPPIGEWVPFDPTWLIRTVADREPGRRDVLEALPACTRTIWDAPHWQSFVGPRLTGGESPFKDGIVVKDHVVGLVSIHLGLDGRVAAIGYLDRIRAAAIR